MVGKILGNRYQIIEKIGEGGTAVVYKARCSLLNRPVAIKVLRSEFNNDADFIRRFQQEAQAAASLSHPNVVSIYDIGQEEGFYYIVMEYVDGQNLKRIIERDAPFSLPDALEIAKQILEALDHAHSHGIVHRDIKPHNILITKGKRVKVTDFGIAKATSNATMVHTGSVVGSVHYLSPEQARGGIVDAKSDLYSVGVILYEMLTGQVPFSGDNPITVALKHIREVPVSPRAINPGIPENVEQIIMKSLAKETYRRFNSAKEMLGAIGEQKMDNVKVLDFEPEDLDEPTQVYGLKKITKKERKDREESFGKNEKNDRLVRTEKKGVNRRAIFIALLVALLLIGLGVFAFYKYISVPEVKVPLLEGLTVEEARKNLQDINLELRVVREVYNPDKQPGRIVYQEIEPGTPVKEHTVINVYVNTSSHTVTVPDLTGETIRSAAIILQDNNLKLGKQDEAYDNETPAGQIIMQDPKANISVPAGSKINVVVSKGKEPQPITMPSLVGSDLAEAKAILRQNNLQLGTVQPDNDPSYGNNVVTRQVPDAGTQILEGSTVNLWANIDNTGGKRDVQINVPNNGNGPQTVRLVLNDSRGSQEIYQQDHSPGDSFTVTVEWVGNNAALQVYINGTLRQEIQL